MLNKEPIKTPDVISIWFHEEINITRIDLERLREARVWVNPRGTGHFDN